MGDKRLSIGIFFIIVLGLFVFFACSKKNPTNPADKNYSNLLENVIFEPESGPPGTPVRLLNLPALPDDGLWTLIIGNTSVPIIKSDSNYYTTIPLLFAPTDSTWPIASDGPLDVILCLDSVGVDTAFSKISIATLAHSDGAVDSMLQDFVNAANAIRDIGQSIGINDTLFQAVCMAMDEIIVSGDNSLSAIINGTSPIVGNDALPKDLVSAMLVSSGASELITSWSDSLQTIQKAAAAFRTKATATSEIDDEGLAYRMQLYSLISDFSSMTIGQTALSWNQISAVLGIAGIVFPPLGTGEFIVSYFVSTMDFIFNKLVVAMFPAEITSFDLDFYDHQLKTGDSTQAIVYISARNNPPNITPLDIVTQVINNMGLAEWIHSLGGPLRYLPANLETVIQNLTLWLIGVINNVLSTNFNAPTMLDVSLPSITYDSVLIENSQLIDLLSPNYSKIEPMDESFNGKAKDSTGTIALMMATQTPGPNTLIHPILAAAGYAGGAFGNDYYTSNTDTVKITDDLILVVSLPDPIDPAGAAVLHVQTRIKQSDGTMNIISGVDISVSMSGGTAEEMSGETDENGLFTTVVHPDAGADYVTAGVTASDSSGATEEKSITVEVQNHCKITEFIHNLTYDGNIHYSLEVICDAPPTSCEFYGYFINTYAAGLYCFTPSGIISSTTYTDMWGKPQGYHGELLLELTTRVYWSEGECQGQMDTKVDTVSIMIP